MSQIEGVRSYLVNKFQTEFLAAYPSVTIRYENIKFDEKYFNGEPIIYIREEPVIQNKISLGLSAKRLEGNFHIYALAPEDTGTKTIRLYIDKGVEIFNGLDEWVPNIGYITTKNVHYGQLDLFRGLYTLSANVTYKCDLCN